MTTFNAGTAVPCAHCARLIEATKEYAIKRNAAVHVQCYRRFKGDNATWHAVLRTLDWYPDANAPHGKNATLP